MLDNILYKKLKYFFWKFLYRKILNVVKFNSLIFHIVFCFRVKL